MINLEQASLEQVQERIKQIQELGVRTPEELSEWDNCWIWVALYWDKWLES